MVFESPVISFAIDPSGNRVAAYCQDGRIRIRDIVTGHESVFPVPGGVPEHTTIFQGRRPNQRVAFHPSGNQLAVITVGNNVALIDINSSATIRGFEGHSDRINAIAFNPNGTQIATCSRDLTIMLWSLTDGSQPHKLRFIIPPSSIAFTPNGERLITGSFNKDPGVKVWDTETGQELYRFSGHQAPVLDVAVSRDGSKIASGSIDQDVFIRDLEGGNLVRLTGHIATVNRIAFSSDASRLISCGEDRMLRIWEATTGRKILDLPQMSSPVMDLAFFPEGDKFLVGRHTETLTIRDGSPWSKEETNPQITLEGHRSRVSAIVFHPSKPVIASASEDATLRLWNVGSRMQMASHDLGQVAFDVSFHPNGTHILSTGYNMDNSAIVDVWSTAIPSERYPIATDDHEIFGATFSPDGKLALFGGRNQDIHVWDWKSKKLIRKLGNSTKGNAHLVFSPNGRHLVTAQTAGIVRLWDANQLTEPQLGRVVYRNSYEWLRPSFSHHSLFLAVGDFEGNVTVLNLENGKDEYSIEAAHGDFVVCTAFSPDGRFLATGSADRTVRLWEAGTGEAVKTFIDHEGMIYCLAFSHDSSQLPSAKR